MVVISEWYPTDKLVIQKYVEEQKRLSAIYEHSEDNVNDRTCSKDLSSLLPVSSIYELPRKKSMIACIDECIQDTKQKLRESEEMEIKMAAIHLELENIDKIDYFMEPLKAEATIVRKTKDVLRNNESCLSVAKRVYQLEESPSVPNLAGVIKIPIFERKSKKIVVPEKPPTIIKKHTSTKADKTVLKAQSFIELTNQAEVKRSILKSPSFPKSKRQLIKSSPLNIQEMLKEAKEKYLIKLESQRSLTLEDVSSSTDALTNITHIGKGRSKYRRDSNVTVIQIMPSEKVSRRIKEIIAVATEETTTISSNKNSSSSNQEIITITKTSSNDTSNLLKLHILSLRMGKIQENMRPKFYRKKPTGII
ncbi:unnamed protein product [Diamesa serratosioi]